MKISTRGRYAVRVMVDIATSNKEYVSISEISSRQNISIKYLEQIISKLVKSNLLLSQRGPSGGYKLVKSPSDYTIGEILCVTKDLSDIVPCINSNKKCPMEHKCLTVGCWESLNKILYDYLYSVTLQNLIDKTY